MRNNTILEIEERDFEQLYNLLESTFNFNVEINKMKELYNLSKENKETHILGYYKNDEIIGTLLYNILILPNAKWITIWNVAVKEEFKRQGIATKLMKEVDKVAEKDKDISRLWLFSGTHREDAHRLYEKLGYNGNIDKGFVKIVNGEEE